MGEPVCVQSTQLRHQSRDLLDQIQGGGCAVITRYGRPIAWVEPWDPDRHPEPGDTPELLVSDRRFEQRVAERSGGEG